MNKVGTSQLTPPGFGIEWVLEFCLMEYCYRLGSKNRTINEIANIGFECSHPPWIQYNFKKPYENIVPPGFGIE